MAAHRPTLGQHGLPFVTVTLQGERDIGRLVLVGAAPVQRASVRLLMADMCPWGSHGAWIPTELLFTFRESLVQGVGVRGVQGLQGLQGRRLRPDQGGVV